MGCGRVNLVIWLIISNLSGLVLCHKFVVEDKYEVRPVYVAEETSKSVLISVKPAQMSKISEYDKLGTPRTYVPSFKMMLLELFLITTSVYLVNSLEEYIKKPASKHRQIEELRLIEHLENVYNYIS